jgi:hypothetical protein
MSPWRGACAAARESRDDGAPPPEFHFKENGGFVDYDLTIGTDVKIFAGKTTNYKICVSGVGTGSSYKYSAARHHHLSRLLL